MRYGLPYKGSKNQIAKWLIDQLPPAETFVDLFFGGGRSSPTLNKNQTIPAEYNHINYTSPLKCGTATRKE